MSKENSRDQFRSQTGFILACIGSAVGMGNIWMFPIRVHQFGGAAFLIPYLIFIVTIGYTGIVEEISFGRAFRSGPVGAFEKATLTKNSKVGKYIGYIPVIGSLGIAIGYSVVVGWSLRFLVGSVTGSMFEVESAKYFADLGTSMGSLRWHFLAILICFIIMIGGISKGIEKVNKVMMPAFFFLFIALAIKISTLPGAEEGYKFLFHPDFEKLKNPLAWIYALGQAFFSLSLAGSGTLVYGSYLSNDEDAPRSAKFTVVFDTIAAVLAAMVIIPALYAYDIKTDGGPVLMFITMPTIFKNMSGGNIASILFFGAVLFAGITSLVNLYETSIELLEQKFGFVRIRAVLLILTLGFLVGLGLENANNLGAWMDILSIYVIPLGALLAGVIFSWVLPKNFILDEVSKGRSKRIGDFYYIKVKYLYCGVTLLVYILGLVFGSIG